MNSSLFLTLFFLFQAFITFPQINAQCAENVLTDTDFLTCSPNHQLDSSSTAFPSYLKTNSFTKLSVEIILNPVLDCSSSSPASDLFILTVQDSSGQEVNVLSFSWLSGGTYQSGASHGIVTVSSTFPSATSFAVNQWIEFVATMDFDNQVQNTGVNVPGLFFYYVPSTTVPFYSSALKFDSNTKFYFCSSLPSIYTGANFHCSIKTFNLWYTYESGATGIHYYGALSPVVLGYYQMDEGTGSILKDSTGNLAKGSFGTPAPTWSSSGVQFTSASQYIELPAFSTASSSSNPMTTQSFTISFWFKFSSATGTANIFRYTTSSLSYDNFGLYVDDTGMLTIGVANQADITASGSLLSPSVWTLITASYTIASSTYSTYNIYYLYQDNAFTVFKIPASPSLSSGPFKVILGGSNGFLGTIAHFRIFSPSVNLVQDVTTCSLSTSLCAINIGLSDSATCVSSPCSSTSHCDQCSGGTFSTCLSCSSDYEFNDDGSSCEPVKTPVSSIIVPTQTVSSGVSKVYNALTKGSSSGFSAAVAGKIFSNIKYLDIGYSLELQEALKYWKSSFVSVGMGLDLPQGLEDNIPELGVPPTFKKYDVSSDFLINFWEGIIVLLFMVVLFGIARALEYFTKAEKHKRFPYTTIRTVRYMTQNLLLSQFDGIFGDITMYSILNYRTQDPKEGLTSFSLVISALLLIITTIILGSQFFLLVKYQSLKKNKEALNKFTQESQGSLIAFEDFKDTSLFRQAFFFLLILRDFLFSLILTTLFEYPLAQTILILVLNLGVLAFLFVKQPFKKLYGFFQQLFYEFVTLAVNICVIILAAKDQERSTAYELRKTTGKFIIITNLVFNFTVIVFLLFGLAMILRENYQEYQVKKAKRITPFAVDTSSSPDIQTKSMMEMDPNKNQTENSMSLHNRTSIKQQSSSRMENSRFLGDVSHMSGNHLLVAQSDPFDESQSQGLSSVERRQRKYQDYLNKRQNQPQIPQREQLRPQQQTLRYHSNSIDRIDEIGQSQNHPQKSQPQNFNLPNRNFDPSNSGNSEAENQRRLAVQARHYALMSLGGQPAFKRRIQSVEDKELQLPQYIRGRHAYKKDS